MPNRVVMNGVKLRLNRKYLIFVCVVVALLGLILGMGTYSKYRKGPYRQWALFLKYWRHADFDSLQTFLSDDPDSDALIIVDRFPHLTLGPEAKKSQFDVLLKRFGKVRRQAREREFRRGLGSRFWDYRLTDVLQMGDRYEFRYQRGAHGLVIVMEQRAGAWKVVDIDNSKSPDLFQVQESELRAEGQI